MTDRGLGRRFWLFFIALWLLPVMAYAQASIAGVVRDTSGAVLPGVTVEAASPVLIEKVRTAVTDGSGQYRIIDLRPGTYTLTFTLSGFNAVKREALELSGTGTLTVNADLRVGALEETITVTGEAPIVDVQNVTRQRVLSREVIDAVPTGRYFANLAVLVPGVTVAGASGSVTGIAQDVGGTSGDSHAQLAVHGSRGSDQRMTIGGVTFGEGNGQTHGMGPNVANMAEITVDTSAVDASQGQGGVRMNFIPRDGGNNFSGGLFFSGANGSMQSRNLSDDLRARGATSGNPVKGMYDISPTLGGPIARDRLWFFASWRHNVVENYNAGAYPNRNHGRSDIWTFEPDLSQPQDFAQAAYRYASGRVTWQASPRNKLALAYDFRDRCTCPENLAQESAIDVVFAPFHLTTFSWSAPLTNKLLLDAGSVHLEAVRTHRPAFGVDLSAIPVTESSPLPGYRATYHGPNQHFTNPFPTLNNRIGLSYVTGAHAFSAGMQWGIGRNDTINHPDVGLIAYGFTRGVPTTVTVSGNPVHTKNRLAADLGIYAQDKWTVDRLTLSGGIRFDYVNTYAPEQVVGPSRFAPNRNITFPETQLLNWKDLSPKMGAAYDVFGTGRTAVRISLNRYVSVQGAGGPGNPAGELQNTAQRAWTDANGNFVVDCDLTNGSLQDTRASGGDLCGAWTGNNVNFGATTPGTAIDPDIRFGWHKRSYNWEFATGVQHALTQRVSVDVGYFRRWYGNFTTTANRALTAADYDLFSVTAPDDARLPDGGGYTISGFRNINPAAASRPTDNYQTFSSNFGEQIENWNGVDTSLNLRLARGLIIQGGTSTGKTTTDNCAVLDAVPSVGVLTAPYCHFESAWLTQVKGLGSYTIPRVDLQVSGTFQSLPGPQIAANLVVPSAQVQASLGRPLSGNAANVTVNMVTPGSMYGERLNQIDLRVGKILRFGRTRSTLSVDLYNLLNANAVINENSTYSAWRTPTGILPPRLLKFTAQIDF